MPNESPDLSPPVNHVFVDYENVREVDQAIIGTKTVHLTLLLGAQKAKFDATVVEKLMLHAATVKLIRLKASGRNALDFTLAYYLGRAVLADPSGYFHIVSKDKGYDPLIEHLCSKHIRAQRHDDFTQLTFKAAAKPLASAPPPTTPEAKPLLKSNASLAHLEALEARVLEHLRRLANKRPTNKKKLVSYLITHLGRDCKGAEVLELVELLGQAGHFATDERGALTYYL